MVGHELAIEQTKSPRLQTGHQPCQCHFGSVAATGKHAFAAKSTANGQAVETADKPVLTGCFIDLPAFDAMRMAKLVELVERLLDLGIDPGFLAIRCFGGTNCYHIGKGAVGGHPETVGSDGFAERTRHPEIVERNNRPGLGFDPEGIRIITRVRHRENARSIGFQQQVEINGHDHQITGSAPFAQ